MYIYSAAMRRVRKNTKILYNNVVTYNCHNSYGIKRFETLFATYNKYYTAVWENSKYRQKQNDFGLPIINLLKIICL